MTTPQNLNASADYILDPITHDGSWFDHEDMDSDGEHVIRIDRETEAALDQDNEAVTIGITWNGRFSDLAELGCGHTFESGDECWVLPKCTIYVGYGSNDSYSENPQRIYYSAVQLTSGHVILVPENDMAIVRWSEPTARQWLTVKYGAELVAPCWLSHYCHLHEQYWIDLNCLTFDPDFISDRPINRELLPHFRHVICPDYVQREAIGRLIENMGGIGFRSE